MSLSPQFCLAFELECGRYEMTGQYNPKTQTLVLSPGSLAETPIHLYGEPVSVSFLRDMGHFYRVQVDVRHRLGNLGGSAEAHSVEGVTQPTENKVPFKLLTPHPCS